MVRVVTRRWFLSVSGGALGGVLAGVAYAAPKPKPSAAYYGRGYKAGGYK